MSSINESISKVRSGLLHPKSQSPTLDELFNALLYEYQNFVNELSTTNLPWTFNSVTVNVASGTTDYLVPMPAGKVLFVTANQSDNNLGPMSLEFADLAEVSSDFFLFSPLDYAFSRDFNEMINWPFPAQIAFYRKGGQLWFRLAPFAYNTTDVTISYSTGDWLSNLSTVDTAVLSQHHALVEVRTCLNLLPGCEWTDDENANQMKRANLDKSLSRQEQRYANQFMYAKRELVADDQPSQRVSSFGW